MASQNSRWCACLPRAPSPSALAKQHLSLLRLKWLSDGGVSEDYKSCLSLSKSGHKLATGANNRLEIWDPQARQLLFAHQIDDCNSACMCWLADDRYLTGSSDSVIRLWMDGQCQGQLSGHHDWIRCIDSFQGEEKLVSGGMSGTLFLWDLVAMREIANCSVAPTGATSCVQGVALAKGEDKVFVLTREGTLCAYDLRNLEPMFPAFAAHQGKGNSIQISEDGTRLLTGARDSTIRLWDVRNLSTHTAQYADHTCRVFPIGAKFLFNESFVVTGSEDKSAYVYDTRSGLLARKVDIGCPVTHVEPTSIDDLSFFVVVYQHQRLGLVDSEGSDVEIEQPTAEEALRDRMKSAIQEALCESANDIYQHLCAINCCDIASSGDLLDVLRKSARTDSRSRELLQEFYRNYSRKLTGPISSAQPQQPVPCCVPCCVPAAPTVPPTVVTEKMGYSPLPAFTPSSTA